VFDRRKKNQSSPGSQLTHAPQAIANTSQGILIQRAEIMSAGVINEL